MSADSPLIPTLRIARPTSNIEKIVSLYTGGLGLSILGDFQDHEGFDGVMLGHPSAPYHLEFTMHEEHPPQGGLSTEDLLVFYVPAHRAWEKRCVAMEQAGFVRVPASNPYWEQAGRTFEDFDGYRVVIQRSRWPPNQPHL